MSNTDIKSAREASGADPSVLAAFIGITTESYWDLEGIEDELLMVSSVVECLRLCVVLGIDPEVLIGTASAGGGRPNITGAFSPHEKGLAEWLRTRVGDLRSAADVAGVELTALHKWLNDDASIMQMPLAALNEICTAVGTPLASALDVLLARLGAPRMR